MCVTTDVAVKRKEKGKRTTDLFCRSPFSSFTGSRPPCTPLFFFPFSTAIALRRGKKKQSAPKRFFSLCSLLPPAVSGIFFSHDWVAAIRNKTRRPIPFSRVGWRNIPSFAGDRLFGRRARARWPPDTCLGATDKRPTVYKMTQKNGFLARMRRHSCTRPPNAGGKTAIAVNRRHASGLAFRQKTMYDWSTSTK